MQIGGGDGHPPGTSWIEVSGGDKFPNHTNAKHAENQNDCVVYWASGLGKDINLGPNFDTVIQSLVNETAKFIAENEVVSAVMKVSYSQSISIQVEELADQICQQIADELVEQ